MTDETKTLITDMLAALRAYELDVDESPPHSHRELVKRAERWIERRRMNKDDVCCGTCRWWKRTDEGLNSVPFGDCGLPLPEKLPMWLRDHGGKSLFESAGSKCKAWKEKAQ